jgi:hypothetical protein
MYLNLILNLCLDLVLEHMVMAGFTRFSQKHPLLLPSLLQHDTKILITANSNIITMTCKMFMIWNLYVFYYFRCYTYLIMYMILYHIRNMTCFTLGTIVCDLFCIWGIWPLWIHGTVNKDKTKRGTCTCLILFWFSICVTFFFINFITFDKNALGMLPNYKHLFSFSKKEYYQNKGTEL